MFAARRDKMWAVDVVATLDVIGLATIYRPATLGVLFQLLACSELQALTPLISLTLRR